MRSFRSTIQSLRAAMLFLAVFAAVLIPSGEASASVVVDDPVDGWSAHGRVYAVDISGDIVYMGGKFGWTSDPDGGGVSRTNVAAMSRTTGDLIQSFEVETDGVVYAIESDGTRVWIGGEFTTVNGEYHPNLVAVDATTGQIDTAFTAVPNRGVRGLHYADGRLWVSGSFWRMNDVRMKRVASLDPVTGANDADFAPNSDSIVRTVELSNDGTYLLVGGGFQNIGGEARRALAKLDPATGAALPSNFPANLSPVLAVETNADDSQIFVGFGGSTGGALFGWNNRVASFDATTSENQWWRRADGDIQALGFHGGFLYFGHHDPFEGDATVRMLRISEAGAIDNSFRPEIDTRRGVLAIDVNSNGLAAGGSFKNVNGESRKGIAIWASDGAQTLNLDTVAPSAPTGLNITKNNGNVVKLEWNDDSTDDRMLAGYRVYRDGVLLKVTTDGGHNDWKPPASGSMVTYDIRAFDISDNEAVAASVTVTIP